MMTSRFIYVVKCMGIFFLFKGQIIFLCMYISHFVYLFVKGHLGHFHSLAIVNKGAMNIIVQLSLSDFAFNSFTYSLVV